MTQRSRTWSHRLRVLVVPVLVMVGVVTIGFGKSNVPSSTTRVHAVEYVVHGPSLPAVRGDIAKVSGTVVRTIPGMNDAIVRLSGAEASRLSQSGLLVSLDNAVHVTDVSPSVAGAPDSVFPQVTGASTLVGSGITGVALPLQCLTRESMRRFLILAGE